MSRADLYKIAGPPQYDPTRANSIKELARFFKRRAGDKIGTEESIRFAAQILANFDHRFRKKREELTASMPIAI